MIRAAFLLVLVATARGGAQVIETPVPFDSGRKVLALTAATVARLGLKPPVWPAGVAFVEARLYSVSSGGTVLSVAQTNGQVERYTFDDAALYALRRTIDSTMALETRIVSGGRPTEAAVQARGAFARNQMILSAIVYGPLIASFADDGKTATALYLLSTGASFFAVSQLARNTYVTRVQNAMATDGTVRGFAATAGLVYAFSDSTLDRKVYSGIGLAGALGGALAGYHYGRRLSDAESQAARSVSTLSAATALGVVGSIGMFRDVEEERPVLGALVAAGVGGYLLGPAYPRRAPYTVTAADVRLLPLGALIGLGAGLTPVISQADSGSEQLVWGAVTAGMLAGTFVMDRTWVRQFDHGHGETTVTWLGATAGMLLGGAVGLLTDTEEPAAWSGLITGGALLGALVAHGATGPAAGTRRSASTDARTPKRSTGVDVQFDASSLGLAAAGVPGHHALLRVRF